MLRERLSVNLKNIERTYAEIKSDLTKVQLSRKIEPSRIAKASDSISGVAVNCNVTVLTKYSASCTEAVSMCLNNNILYLSQKGYPGGILSIAMPTLEETVIVQNGTVECSERAHVHSRVSRWYI